MIRVRKEPHHDTELTKSWQQEPLQPIFLFYTPVHFFPFSPLEKNFILVDEWTVSFEINVRTEDGRAVENAFRVCIVLSHHLKSCQYLQQSIDPPSPLQGPQLYSVLIDYVDSLCRVWMSCPCHDIRPWQQAHLFAWAGVMSFKAPPQNGVLLARNWW